MKTLFIIILSFVLLTCNAANAAHHEQTKVYELRTYTTHEGKLDALLSRFRDHTLTIFEKHNMQNIGYWLPDDQPNTLIYIIAHKDKAMAKKSWQAFIADPQWKKVYAASIADGKIVSNITSVYMNAADFSAIK